MNTSGKKVFLSEIEITTKQESIAEASKMPRTAVIPVVRDRSTGYLNAAPYSGGVMSVKPYHIIFGVKSWDTKLVFEEADEFVVAIPSKDQLDHMWSMACAVPHGITEIEIAGWTELPSRGMETPGIKECRINLECKKVHLIKLGRALRNIIIAEVVGISIDTNLLEMSRSEIVRLLPMHEAIQRHPYTATYAVSVLSGEAYSGWELRAPVTKRIGGKDKIYVNREQLYDHENEGVLINAIFPRPTYIVTYVDNKDETYGFPVSGGLIMHTKPAVQIPIPKSSSVYRNIKECGEFVVSIPIRSHISNLEKLEQDAEGKVEHAGFTPLSSGHIKTPGIKECPINIECKVYLIEDIPGNDYALLIGTKVGLSVDEEISQFGNFMQLYSQYLYAVMDWGMVKKWAFHDINSLPVKPLPTWGSRYNGGWWGGSEQWQAGMQFWLVELLHSGYLSEEEYHNIKRWISWWRSEGYLVPEPLRSQLRMRLTTLLHMMVWAHRDFDKWHDIHEFLGKFPYEGRWGC